LERANDRGTHPIGPLGPALAALSALAVRMQREHAIRGALPSGPADPHAGK
jgi:hypothetical protein